MYLLPQIDFTALALKLNTSDSAAKQKWLDVMRKENDKMVCYIFCSTLPFYIMTLHWGHQQQCCLSQVQSKHVLVCRLVWQVGNSIAFS